VPKPSMSLFGPSAIEPFRGSLIGRTLRRARARNETEIESTGARGTRLGSVLKPWPIWETCGSLTLLPAGRINDHDRPAPRRGKRRPETPTAAASPSGNTTGFQD